MYEAWGKGWILKNRSQYYVLLLHKNYYIGTLVYRMYTKLECFLKVDQQFSYKTKTRLLNFFWPQSYDFDLQRQRCKFLQRN
jgi:hypothetical protein